MTESTSLQQPRKVMKAKPVRIVQGVGYVQCAVEEATHVELNVPGPTGYLVLPVILRGTRDGTGCWTWNGDTESPTLRPSVLTNGTYRMTDEEYARARSGVKVTPRPYRCHSWINDGAAQFLSDSSHELANQTVPLLDVAPDACPHGVDDGACKEYYHSATDGAKHG